MNGQNGPICGQNHRHVMDLPGNVVNICRWSSEDEQIPNNIKHGIAERYFYQRDRKPIFVQQISNLQKYSFQTESKKVFSPVLAFDTSYLDGWFRGFGRH